MLSKKTFDRRELFNGKRCSRCHSDTKAPWHIGLKGSCTFQKCIDFTQCEYLAGHPEETKRRNEDREEKRKKRDEEKKEQELEREWKKYKKDQAREEKKRQEEEEKKSRQLKKDKYKFKNHLRDLKSTLKRTAMMIS